MCQRQEKKSTAAVAFFDDPAAKRAMICLGLITEFVPWSLLIDCAKGICLTSDSCQMSSSKGNAAFLETSGDT